jgi:hypothetical protein
MDTNQDSFLCDLNKNIRSKSTYPILKWDKVFFPLLCEPRRKNTKFIRKTKNAFHRWDTSILPDKKSPRSLTASKMLASINPVAGAERSQRRLFLSIARGRSR